MNNSQSFEVTVKEALHEDAGRGIARISIDVMNALDLRSGDVIEISGKNKAAAIVWTGYSQDTGKAIIRIDGNIRGNIQTGIDEKVTIRKVDAKYAEKVVIHPTQPISLRGGEQYIGRLLSGRPVSEGQAFRVNIMGNALTFVISKVKPSGVAIVGPETEIEIKDTPYEPKEGSKKDVPDVHYEDIGGLGRELDQVREMIELPLRHPEIFEKLGIEPPKGVLLYGPPGTGKTLIAKAVANEVDAHFMTLSGPEIVSKYYGESEGKLREVFEEAQKNAPTIIFIDEIDSIAPKREETKGEVERRIVAQLLSLMDGLKGRGEVIVIAATNLPDNIDPALRRGGRFDREIEIGIPDRKGRLEIFQVHTRGVPLDLSEISISSEESVELSRKFAEMGETEGKKHEDEIKRKKFLEPFSAVTHGFVGADISLLVKEAAMHALREELRDIKTGEDIPIEIIEKIKVKRSDFEEALRHVEPSAMREVLVEIPDISWDDIGGLEDIKKELTESVEWPLKYPEIFDKFDTKPPSGILLFGPPGTGKTLLAKAVANKSECNFISVKGPELLSKWVGESEKGVRDIFRKARQASPSIIFFDEIDALLPKRGTFEGSSHVTESVVSQILTELDGLEELKNVTVLGATNRPDMLDEALMRPGRLDRIIYVPPPDAKGRKKIFEVYLKNSKSLLSEDISIDELVLQSEGYVGADIELVVREAKLQAMREFITLMDSRTEEERQKVLDNVRVTKEHFNAAMKKIKSSLDKSAIEEYERKAWPVMYSTDERQILEKAASAIKRSEFGEDAEDKTECRKKLEKVTYSRLKDFEQIKKLTGELISKIEQ
ncbi:CDC48 family AAA ATPase [Methanomicrobium antiquum]|uniref:CDC48 family AAA ATPase n=1 Tax=Methanomicrobium antiquum TaxID=487686 RepID=A0AAF0FSL2_9EURY|nr:CDC48 family AAA ATPase [Methanomicrobium antiquum]MDD3978319.1 CDC48 family AAA ATPase [Methanomicrobium sp.]WFN35798.1 CDC48 family AAA ATPase [Methanomicrobium antiquum]